jgi:phage-related protein
MDLPAGMSSPPDRTTCHPAFARHRCDLERLERPSSLTICLNRHSLLRGGCERLSMATRDQTPPKPVRWVGTSKEDLRIFPEEVRRQVGSALWDAQLGRKSPFAKPLKGFQGAGVLEVVDDFDGDSYRAIYTVRFAGVIYVLHAFQKKSKHGIATPRKELELIEKRLKRAREDYDQWARRGNLTSR